MKVWIKILDVGLIIFSVVLILGFPAILYFWEQLSIKGVIDIVMILYLVLYFIAFLLCFSHIFFTKHVTEFRVGWLLTLLASLPTGLFPLMLPLFRHYAVVKIKGDYNVA